MIDLAGMGPAGQDPGMYRCHAIDSASARIIVIMVCRWDGPSSDNHSEREVIKIRFYTSGTAPPTGSGCHQHKNYVLGDRPRDGEHRRPKPAALPPCRLAAPSILRVGACGR